MKFSLLWQPVDLLKLLPVSFHLISIQRRALFYGDFKLNTLCIVVGFLLSGCKLTFQLGMMIQLYLTVVVPDVMTLTSLELTR